MIWINVRFTVKDEYVSQWLERTQAFTDATRAEEGNLFFDWYRSADEDNVFLLCEGFTDEGAGPHVESEHFRQGTETMKPMLVSTPQIISEQIDGEGWGPMGEIQVD